MMDPPLSADALAKAVALFNQQQFFACHEVLEDALWRPEPDATLKLAYQGVLQIAVGYHHAQQGNAIGMHHLLQRGMDKLIVLTNSEHALVVASGAHTIDLRALWGPLWVPVKEAITAAAKVERGHTIVWADYPTLAWEAALEAKAAKEALEDL